MIYFKLLLILFILIILLFVNNQFNFKEQFHTSHSRIFNIYRLFRNSSALNCDIANFNWPLQDSNQNQQNFFKIIMDNNFTTFKELVTIKFENQLIKQLHKQTFNELPKLNYVSFHGNPINLISSDILSNNMGRTNNEAGDTRKLVLSLPINNEKILIICYQNVIERLSELNDYSEILTNLNFDDANIAATERKLYDFLYNNENMQNSSYIKKLVKRALGVEETSLNKFNLYKKNGDQDIELTEDEILTHFQIVYYKDIFFTTDMAYWRTGIFNSIIGTDAEEQTNADFITNYSIYSNYTYNNNVKNEYLTPIHIMIELITLEKEITTLKNLMGLERSEVADEINSKENRINYLEDLQETYLETISDYKIPTNVFEFYMSNYINECSLNEACASIFPSRDSQGRLVIPDFARDYEVPEFDFNHDFSVATQCTSDIELPEEADDQDNQVENCDCNLYKVIYVSNGVRQVVPNVSKIDPTIDIFYSLNHLEEHLRHKHLTDIVRLFALTIDGPYYKNMINYSNLFLAIPTLGRYLS